MTSKDAVKYYETEAKKEEIRSECARNKGEEALHKAKAKKLSRAAATIKKLFCSTYHKAAFTLDDL